MHKDGKLLIVESEAEQVRTIFKQYLALGSVNRLVIELRERRVRSKVRKLANGKTRGGVFFTQDRCFACCVTGSMLAKSATRDLPWTSATFVGSRTL
jgi:hypothetical protein